MPYTLILYVASIRQLYDTFGFITLLLRYWIRGLCSTVIIFYYILFLVFFEGQWVNLHVTKTREWLYRQSMAVKQRSVWSGVRGDAHRVECNLPCVFLE